MQVDVMEKERIVSLLNDLQHGIFYDQMTDFAENFACLAEALEQIAVRISDGRRHGFNQILAAILHACENKDYLLMADLIEFELKPFLQGV